MGRKVSLFIIITTGKHAGSVLVYYHLSVFSSASAVLNNELFSISSISLQLRKLYQSQKEKKTFPLFKKSIVTPEVRWSLVSFFLLCNGGNIMLHLDANNCVSSNFCHGCNSRKYVFKMSKEIVTCQQEPINWSLFKPEYDLWGDFSFLAHQTMDARLYTLFSKEIRPKP